MPDKTLSIKASDVLNELEPTFSEMSSAIFSARKHSLDNIWLQHALIAYQTKILRTEMDDHFIYYYTDMSYDQYQIIRDDLRPD